MTLEHQPKISLKTYKALESTLHKARADRDHYKKLAGELNAALIGVRDWVRVGKGDEAEVVEAMDAVLANFRESQGEGG